MIDKLTSEQQAQMLKWLQIEDPKLATAYRRKIDAEFASDPTRPPLELLTADEILTTDWPEPTWAVPNLLPVGLTILAGRPKVGKSWLALQIAQSVASGGVALGERIEQGPVLYLALEDTERRLKDRMTRQGWTTGLTADFMRMGQFQVQIDDLCNGGGERLARQIEWRGYRYVVIDTLSRSIYGDQDDVGAMTLALAPIQAIAHDENCAVIMVDHHRKMFLSDPDCVSDILGSTAKGAMADSIWGLYKERGKAGAKLAITGRDIEERTLALNFDAMLGCWQCEGDADVLELTERRQEILDALEVLGRSGVVDIAKAIEQPKSHTYTRLQDLVNAGLVQRYSKGRRVYYELFEE